MTVVTWNPGFAYRKSEKSMRTLPDLMNEFFGMESHSAPKRIEPGVNIMENEDAFSIQMALPGFSKEDINIDLDENVLKVSGRKNAEESKDIQYWRKEFLQGEFEKQFIVPDSVDTDKISGSMEEGVLNLTLPKREELKPKPARSIQIN